MFVGTGVLSIGAFCYFYFTSLQYCPLSVSAILLYTSPVFIMLFSALLFHEKITPRKLLAMALALVGCGLVSGLMDGFGSVPVYGVVTGLLSGLLTPCTASLQGWPCRNTIPSPSTYIPSCSPPWRPCLWGARLLPYRAS